MVYANHLCSYCGKRGHVMRCCMHDPEAKLYFPRDEEYKAALQYENNVLENVDEQIHKIQPQRMK